MPEAKGSRNVRGVDRRGSGVPRAPATSKWYF